MTRWCLTLSIAVLTLVLATQPCAAQLRGHYLPGTAGLQAGTQGTPGLTVAFPVYFYPSDTLKNDDGGTVNTGTSVSALMMAPALVWVTNVKLLGGTLGGQATPVAFIKSRLEGPSFEVPGELAFTDLMVQPLQLGWHRPRADYVAGYSVFIPTGEWEFLGADNAGLGMWSHLIQAGTTVRLDDKRAWTAALMGSFEMHSKLEDTDIRVGNIFTFEGGVGRTFYHMLSDSPIPRIANLGLVYYGEFKASSDQAGPYLNPLLRGRENRVFGVGVEANVFLPKPRLFLSVRAIPEFGARNRTQGFTLLVTAARELKSFVKLPSAH